MLNTIYTTKYPNNTFIFIQLDSFWGQKNSGSDLRPIFVFGNLDSNPRAPRTHHRCYTIADTSRTLSSALNLVVTW